MNLLPKEIVLIILENLNYKDKRRFLRTSKSNLLLNTIVMKNVKYGVYYFRPDYSHGGGIYKLLLIGDNIGICHAFIDTLLKTRINYIRSYHVFNNENNYTVYGKNAINEDICLDCGYVIDEIMLYLFLLQCVCYIHFNLFCKIDTSFLPFYSICVIFNGLIISPISTRRPLTTGVVRL